MKLINSLFLLLIYYCLCLETKAQHCEEWQNSTIQVKITQIQQVSDQISYLISEDGALYKSEDDGGSWVKIPGAPEGINKIDFVTNGVGVLTDGIKFYHTADDGKSWSLIIERSGTASRYGWDMVNDTTLFYATDTEVVRYNLITDVKDTTLNEEVIKEGLQVQSIYESQPSDVIFLNDTLGYILFYYCCSDNYDEDYPIFKTIDGGESWQFLSFAKKPEMWIHDFAVPSEDRLYCMGQVQIGGGGVLFYDTDFTFTTDGVSWNSVWTGLGAQIPPGYGKDPWPWVRHPVWSILPNGNMYILANRNQRELQLRNNNGKTKRVLQGGIDGHLVYFTDDSTGYVARANALYHTKDMGVTWANYTQKGDSLVLNEYRTICSRGLKIVYHENMDFSDCRIEKEISIINTGKDTLVVDSIWHYALIFSWYSGSIPPGDTIRISVRQILPGESPDVPFQISSNRTHGSNPWRRMSLATDNTCITGIEEEEQPFKVVNPAVNGYLKILGKIPDGKIHYLLTTPDRKECLSGVINKSSQVDEIGLPAALSDGLYLLKLWNDNFSKTFKIVLLK